MGAVVALAVVGGSVLASASGAQALPTGVVDQTNTSGTPLASGAQPWAQTFTPAISGQITAVDLDFGSAPGSITVSVQTLGANGLPSGVVLASGSASVTSGWVDVPLTGSTPLVAGTEYAIVIPQTTSIMYNGTYQASVYPGGQLIWTGVMTYPTYDALFRTYMTSPATIAGTPTTQVAVNHPYSYAYLLGGTPAPDLSVTQGALPAGLTLSPTGVVSGTPTTVGTSTFRIHASNSQGSQDIVSTIVVRDAIVPSAPNAVTATAGSSAADVSWARPTTAGDDAVQHYTVTSVPAGFTATTADTHTTITGLTPGTTYSFRVTATSASGTGVAATSGPVTPYTVAGAPASVGAVATDGGAQLTWSAPESDGYATVTGYTVTESVDGGAFTAVPTADLTATGDTTATVSGLTNGTAYRFAVAARNAAGTGATTESADTTPYGLAPAPAAPTATIGARSVQLTWTAPSSDNGSAITGFAVQSSTDGTTWTAAASTTDPAATISGLTNGTAYAFRVAAVNAAGTGAWSDSVSATPLSVAAAPTVLTVTPGSGTATVTWTAPTDDGGTPVTGFTVEYRAGDGAWTTGATTDAATTTAAVTGLQNGTAYAFRVIATNAVGAGAASGVGSATTTTPFVFTPTAVESDTPLAGKTIEVGDQVHLNATGLPVGSVVTVQLHSTVVTLATVTVGADGVFDAEVMIPATTAAGAHELTMTLSGTGTEPVTTTTAFTVAVPTPVAVTGAVAREAVHRAATTLAFTGGPVSPAVLIAAALALLVGSALVVLGRRRRREA